MACVDLKVGSWTGKCNLMVVPLDDFDVILGMDFMLLASAMEVPNEVAEVLEEFKDVFPPELPKKLPLCRAIDHAIELEPGARPPAQAPYRIGPAELAELRKQLDGLLEAGLIQPSKVRKQDGSIRMCVDYRALNKVTIKNKYPIPNAMDLFDKLTKARYYTKIDLRSGYWQVRVARGDEPKSTCVMRYGSFEFLVMLFGLTNAPATLYRFLVVYLDDIVVYSESLIDHVKHLRAVFQKLREYELYAKKEKCEFCCEQITFLGHVISQERIQMDSRKVKAMVDWGEGYSKIVNPLTDLLKKDQKWEWTVACDDAFRLLKQAISTQPVLQLPQFDRPFEVQVDASDRALWGVLVQDKHLVAFESRKLKEAELRELQCGQHVFQNAKEAVPETGSLAGVLGEFDFEWVHRPGKHNDVEDALNRKMVEEYVAALKVVESDLLDQIRESSKTDASYIKLVEQVKNGQIPKYWLDSGLLYAKGGRAFVSTGPLCRRLLRETNDPEWARHPSIEEYWLVGIIGRGWRKMLRPKDCLVYQLDKVERKKEAGLLQPLPIPEGPWH
ncbi:UNVERIFIED_CONTAM: Transposon Ty3-I Gag-Pol polyprotein [Sesamum latifolium]|uniref:Transposon Ty3-I Gag-Pol polyprotein n=1 Tax=Sesamum latifolium TaxID=2727402 RepID=A0AAW2YAC2_9LAMI